MSVILNYHQLCSCNINIKLICFRSTKKKMAKRKQYNKNTSISKHTCYDEEIEEEKSEENVEREKEEERVEEEKNESESEKEKGEKEAEGNEESEGKEETEREEETQGEEETEFSENKNDNNKDNKDRSFVWSHFERITDNNGTKWARCKYCR